MWSSLRSSSLGACPLHHTRGTDALLCATSRLSPRVHTHAHRFLCAGKGAPGADAFETFRAELVATHPKCRFCGTVAELPSLANGPVMALIAGRTADAPGCFDELVAKGVSHIYLEKPGATSAVRLEAMSQAAARAGVPVLVGYNKNVAQYSREALESLAARRVAGQPVPLVTLEHCNAFLPGKELIDFVSGAGAEGMLHNMGCHELALAATLFGVTPERIVSLTLHPEASELLTLSDGVGVDWSHAGFTLALHPTDAETPAGVAPTALKFSFDRCG